MRRKTTATAKEGGRFPSGMTTKRATAAAQELGRSGGGGLGGDLAVGGEEEAGGSFAVGAPGLGVGGLEAFEDFVAGVAEGVAAAGADDGFAGSDGGEEFGVGGGFAAVVADFEESDGC